MWRKLDWYDDSLNWKKQNRRQTNLRFSFLRKATKKASWLFTATNENTSQSGWINAILQSNKVYSKLLFYNPSEYTIHKFIFTTKEQETKHSKINNHLYTYTKNNRIFLSSWITACSVTTLCRWTVILVMRLPFFLIIDFTL